MKPMLSLVSRSSISFLFLRGTFYRWAQLWPVFCAELSVGDLHVNSFETWRDAEGASAGVLTPAGERELFLGSGMRGVHSTAVIGNGASTLHKLSFSGHNWTAWPGIVLPHCGYGNENDSGISRGRAPTPGRHPAADGRRSRPHPVAAPGPPSHSEAAQPGMAGSS